MIFSIIVRKKYLYRAFKIIFSPETFLTSLGHTGDNLERRFRRHLGGRGLRRPDPKTKPNKKILARPLDSVPNSLKENKCLLF